MSENHVVGTKKGNIYEIVLNRPEKRNAITFEMITDLAAMVEELPLDPEIRAVILKGEGKVFSAGIDFSALGSLVGRFMGDQAAGGGLIRADISKFQGLLNRLEAIEVPIVCAMHGTAVGLGVEIALACDIRLMSDDCLWGMPEIRLGLIADLGGTARLSRIVGQARAMEILMTNRRYTAAQALNWGFVNYTYPDLESLYAGAEELAADIAKNAPLAVGAEKRVIKMGDSVDLMTQLAMEVDLQSILLRSEDFKEGIQSMMEKRDPNWKRR